ncbi:MAG: peptide chain release factor N(5)-glutamine methyltransferase [Bacilli bacterium]|jgi:release factor glutamine methyltransferase
MKEIKPAVEIDKTAGDLLREAAPVLRNAGIDTARLDTELLLAQVLKVDRISFYVHPDRRVSEKEQEEFLELIERREKREPIAYITGHKEFMGLDFLVEPGLLIPRPDTEVIVEWIIGRLDGRTGLNILDLCSGSGAIGLSAGSALPGAGIVLSDLSETAVRVGTDNARRLGVPAEIRHGNLFKTIRSGERFDLIVSNPPYIADDEIDGLEPEVSEWEPRIALSGGADGYQIYRRIIREADSFLKPGGILILEAGDGQAQTLAGILEKSGFGSIELIPDLTGTVRGVAAFLSEKPVCDTI